MTKSFRFTLVWIIGAFFAVLMSMNPLSAAFVDGHYIPVGNDSFYHAHRILDTVADPNSFYEFDDKIHAPEGSLLVWPWAYDYVMAGIVRGILHTGLADHPMKVLAYLPVAAIVLSVGLVVGVAITLELSWFGALLLALSVAFSSLTQTLHGVGNIDHHFVEYIFILATLLLGLNWMKNPQSWRSAAYLGGILGIAPAFQNGLFVLQIPLLITITILWIRNIRLQKLPACTFSLALVLGTLLAVLPSEPFREGFFDFYFLSWFHLYVALCTSAFVLLTATFTPSAKSATGILAFAVLAMSPLLSQVTTGTAFIAGSLGVLPNIVETQSVLRLATERGIPWIVEFYSLFVFLAPLVLAGCIWVAVRRRSDPQIVWTCVSCACGLALLLMQFRFHIYGSLALILPWIVYANRAKVASTRKRAVITATLAVVVAAAYAPSIRNQLFKKKTPGNDSYYALTRAIYPFMAEACHKHPGVVLAGSDAGHYIRFHTDCSVIANNFLITPQHFTKFLEVNRLMAMTPEQLLASDVKIRYVFVSLADIASAKGSGSIVAKTPEDLRQIKPPLVSMLLFSPIKSIDPRYHLIKELRFAGDSGAAYARLFAIDPQY